MKDFLSNFQIQKQGLASVLGELESVVMSLAWEKGELTVRQAHRCLAEQRTIAYTTVMTVMTRLADKGLLLARKDGNAFVYRPAMNREEFNHTTRGKIIDALIGVFGTPVISQFVETIDREHPERMEELAQLVARKREQQDE